jgi:hypothetical protein
MKPDARGVGRIMLAACEVETANRREALIVGALVRQLTNHGDASVSSVVKALQWADPGEVRNIMRRFRDNYDPNHPLGAP